MSFLWPEEGDFPENLHRVVYVIINKRSFEPFMCLDISNLVFYAPATFTVISGQGEVECLSAFG